MGIGLRVRSVPRFGIRWAKHLDGLVGHGARLGDALHYMAGKLLGRTKLAARVSPSKTVGGPVGGGLLAVGVGTALHCAKPFTPLQASAMSTVIVMAESFGGLALSAVKRSLGAKDWGQMIEGHLRMLDRLDSVSFAAQVFLLCVGNSFRSRQPLDEFNRVARWSLHQGQQERRRKVPNANLRY